MNPESPKTYRSPVPSQKVFWRDSPQFNRINDSPLLRIPEEDALNEFLTTDSRTQEEKENTAEDQNHRMMIDDFSQMPSWLSRKSPKTSTPKRRITAPLRPLKTIDFSRDEDRPQTSGTNHKLDNSMDDDEWDTNLVVPNTQASTIQQANGQAPFNFLKPNDPPKQKPIVPSQRFKQAQKLIIGQPERRPLHTQRLHIQTQRPPATNQSHKFPLHRHTAPAQKTTTTQSSALQAPRPANKISLPAAMKQTTSKPLTLRRTQSLDRMTQSRKKPTQQFTVMVFKPKPPLVKQTCRQQQQIGEKRRTPLDNLHDDDILDGYVPPQKVQKQF